MGTQVKNRRTWTATVLHFPLLMLLLVAGLTACQPEASEQEVRQIIRQKVTEMNTSHGENGFVREFHILDLHQNPSGKNSWIATLDLSLYFPRMGEDANTLSMKETIRIEQRNEGWTITRLPSPEPNTPAETSDKAAENPLTPPSPSAPD